MAWSTSSISALVLGSLLLLGLFVLQKLQLAYTSPYAKIPGPWHSRLTRLRLKLAILAGQRVHYVHALHLQYGPIVLVAPTEVSVCDLEAYKTIYNARAGFAKTDWYFKFTTADHHGVFTMPDAKDHAQRRKLLAKGFQKSNLRKDFQSTVLKFAKGAIQGMKKDAQKNGQIDVMKWWMFYTTDIAGTALFGENFNLVESGKLTLFPRAMHNFLLGSGLAAELPFLKTIAPYVPIAAFREPFSARGTITKFAQRATINAKDTSIKTYNIFATIFSESDKESTLLTDEMVVTEATNLTIAGSDTSASTLTYLTWLVLDRPKLREALEAELSALSEDELNDQTLEQLPILNAVIMETLRLYGAAPTGLPRLVPQGGTELCGFAIPADAIVSAQAWSLARLPNVWGQNFAEFDHTRWLDKESVTPAMMAAWKPWGGDPRSCLGIHLAWMEIRLAAAVFFRNCKGASMAKGFEPADMVPEEYFLIKPKSHKCMISL